MVLQFFLSKSFQRNKLMLHPSDSALKPVSIRGFTLACTVELRFADTCLIRVYHHYYRRFSLSVGKESPYISSIICLEFSITWGRLKICTWPFHSRTIFKAYLINSPRLSEILFFTFYFPSKAVFRRKKEPKLFGFKNVVARGIRKFLTWVIRQISSKISEK